MNLWSTSDPGAFRKRVELTDLVPDPVVNRFRDAQAGLFEVIQQDVFEVLLGFFRPVDFEHRDGVMPTLALSWTGAAPITAPSRRHGERISCFRF